MGSKFYFKKADSLGITFSAICLLHCLTFPVLLSLSTIGSVISFLQNIYMFEYVFLFFAFLAIYFATKKASSIKIKRAFYVVFAILMVSFFLHEYNIVAKVISVISSLALILLHIINLRKPVKEVN
jgi:hypothetical protein